MRDPKQVNEQKNETENPAPPYVAQEHIRDAILVTSYGCDPIVPEGLRHDP